MQMLRAFSKADVGADVRLKTIANLWVEDFWFTLSNSDILVDTRDISYFNDKISCYSITKSKPETQYTEIILNRFKWYGVQITHKALIFLSNQWFSSNNAYIYMAVLAIVHKYRSSYTENVITYKWLDSLFESRILTSDEVIRLWDSQLLDDGTDLVDHQDVFDSTVLREQQLEAA